MNFEFFYMIIKLIFSLVVVLGLLFIAAKTSFGKINNINDKKYIKVLERVQISKDIYICVVKIGKKAHILTVSSGAVDKIEELSPEETLEIENLKKYQLQQMEEKYLDVLNISKDFFTRAASKFKLKDGKNEK